MKTRSYKRDLKALELRRRKGMRMLLRGVPQADVARELGVSRQTASAWAAQCAVDKQAWRRGPLGRPGGLSDPQRAKLARMLLEGALANGFATELWTLPRVAMLIEREFGPRYSTVHVWRILKALGFSSQRPVGRATQRDEQAIVQWKEQRWPMLKKKPAAREEPSCSSTKQD